MPTDPNNERYVHDFADGEYGWGEGTDTKDGYQDIIDQLEHDVPVVAPESEIEQYRALPGRRFVAEDTTREYIGDGSAWVQVASRGPNPTFESAEVKGALHSGELSTKTKPVYDVTQWGAVGDGTTDDRQAIQSAIDAANADGGGTVYLPSPSDHYSVATSGKTDPDTINNEEYALELKSNVSLVGEDRDTTVIKTPDKEVTPIWMNGISNWSVERLTVDGNYHVSGQTNWRNPGRPVQCIKVGATGVPSSGCTNGDIIDCRITGAIRHGIDTQYAEHLHIERVVFDDAAGDDCLSISTESAYVTVERCWSINRDRDSGWNSGCFEIEDGAHHVTFKSLYAIKPGASSGTQTSGFVVGKSHTDKPASHHHHLEDCHAIAPDGHGFELEPNGADVYDVTISNWSVVGSNGSGLAVAGYSSSKLTDLHVDDGFVRNAGNIGIKIEKFDDATLDNINIIDSGKDGDHAAIHSNDGHLKGSNITIKNCRKGIIVESGSATLSTGSVEGCDKENGILMLSETDVTDFTVKNNGGSSTFSRGIRVNADNCTIKGCDIYDDQSTKTQNQTITVANSTSGTKISGTRLGPDSGGGSPVKGTDIRIDNCDIETNVFDSEGTRVTYDGVGKNAGDPNSTGQWNGNGREGLWVLDTNNSTKYLYRNGGWV